MGESTIAARIETWEENLPNHIKLAYLPSLGRVRLRLSTIGIDQELIEKEVDHLMEELQVTLKDIAVGFEGDTSIEQRIGDFLLTKGHTLSLAESCTGGAIAQQITANAGASAYYRGSLVPYATDLKTSILGVDDALIREHSVVSDPVAKAMATQAKKLFQSEYSIATTGIAGPTKGDAIDEVGTVFIAIGSPEGVVSEKFNFGTSRERVIKKTVNKAFEMLYKEISKN